MRNRGRGSGEDATCRVTAALRKACTAHIEYLCRKGLCERPSAPLEPGAKAAPIPIDAQRAGALISLAARQAAAGDGSPSPGDAEDLPRAAVWTSGANTLLVLLDALSVRTADGVATVSVDVACDELRATTGKPTARISIDFVVGTERRPAGLLAAATPPHGPQLIVERWGDALVALAWRAMLDAATALAAGAGADIDGAALLPTSWTASAKGIAVSPQARHEIDRRVPTALRR